MRQLLIIFQFCCATALVIISLSVNRQINYMMTMDLGYEQEDLFFVFNPEDEQMESRFLSMKNKLEQYPEILMVSAGHNVPCVIINRSAARTLGHSPEEIIGKQLASDDPEIIPRIVGVVEDIHFTSGHEQRYKIGKRFFGLQKIRIFADANGSVA